MEMDIKEYSAKKDGPMMLGKNFSVREFACHDGTDKVLIDPDLVILLQRIRDHFGPIVISSGYRTPTWNAQQPNASNVSQHMLGTAADMQISGAAPIDVARYVEYLIPMTGGIGLYNWGVHVDVRKARSRWDQRSSIQVGVSGFPGFVAPTQTEPKPQPMASVEPAAAPMRVNIKHPATGTVTDLEGVRINGSVYAPVRAIGEGLGRVVDWDPADGGTVTVR
jgi:hypothetical protein